MQDSANAREKVVVVGEPTPTLAGTVTALRARNLHVLGPYGEDRLDEVDSFADCAVVDLSEGDGALRLELAELCRKVAVQVLVITELSDTKSRINALRLGASDHCVAPYEPQEVVARVEMLLARRRRMRRGHLTSGDLTVVIPERRVVRNGEDILLTRREFDVLVALMRADGNTVSKEQLLHEVWQDNGHSVNLVEAHVSALRRKLEAAGPPVIRTVHRRGYSFQARRPTAPLTRESLLAERARLLRERDEAVRRRDELMAKLRRNLDRT